MPDFLDNFDFLNNLDNPDNLDDQIAPQKSPNHPADYDIAAALLLPNNEEYHEQREERKDYGLKENNDKIVFPQIPIQPNPKDPIILGELLDQTEDMIKVKYIDPKWRECYTWEFKSNITELQKKIWELPTEALDETTSEWKRVLIPYGETTVYAKIKSYDSENKSYRLTLTDDKDAELILISKTEVDQLNTVSEAIDNE